MTYILKYIQAWIRSHTASPVLRRRGHTARRRLGASGALTRPPPISSRSPTPWTRRPLATPQARRAPHPS